MFSVLHEQAMAAARKLKKAEAELVGLLIRIEACRGFKELGHASLFDYVKKSLKLSEACAQQLIYVSRKCREVPALLEAIERGNLTVSKAKIIVPVIDSKNHKKWIDMVMKLSARTVERMVAAENPEASARESIRYKGRNRARLAVDLDQEALDALKRSRELLAQKKSKPMKIADVIKWLATEFVSKNDPVIKADRTYHVNGNPLRSVHRRDRGRCQFKLPTGELCGARQWLHVHHIKPKAEGGTDDPENLITLCSAHHRQVHTH